MNRDRNYYIAGVFLAVCTYMVFFFLRNTIDLKFLNIQIYIRTSTPVKVCTLIHYLGLYASIVLISLGLGVKYMKIDYLQYIFRIYPAIFFTGLIYLYIYNYFADQKIKTNNTILLIISTVVFAFLVYIWLRWLQNWIRYLLLKLINYSKKLWKL